jgi:hypothetical protein
MVDFMSCNYLSLTRTGKTIYAWIDDVNVINDEVFEIKYSVDSWRTFRSKIDLGVQFIKRTYTETFLLDKLLGSIQPYYDVTSTNYSIGAATKRIAVVQVRGTGGQTMSNSPVQPTPYQFYLTEYSLNSWQDSQPLVDLMSALPQNAETQNLVTIYSIPWIDISGISTAPLIITIDNNPSITVNGWKGVTSDTDMSGLLYNETPILTDGASDLMRVAHSIQIVIPEAGIINVPDELWNSGSLKLRQDIDLFSGACNYMLTTGSYATGDYCLYTESVRGSSVSSIPILTNPRRHLYLTESERLDY